jgi:hypothetical protein
MSTTGYIVYAIRLIMISEYTKLLWGTCSEESQPLHNPEESTVALQTTSQKP